MLCNDQEVSPTDKTQIPDEAMVTGSFHKSMLRHEHALHKRKRTVKTHQVLDSLQTYIGPPVKPTDRQRSGLVRSLGLPSNTNGIRLNFTLEK